MGSDTTHPETSFYFFMQGIACLILWSAILGTFPYFEQKMPTSQVIFYFPCAIYTGLIVGNLLIMKVSRLLQFNKRVLLHMFLLIAASILLPLASIILPNEQSRFIVSMVILFVVGYANQIYQSSIVGMASQMNSKYNAHMLSGSGVSCLFMNGLRAVSILGLENEVNYMPDSVMMIYYGAGSFLFILSAMLQCKFVSSKDYIEFE